MVLTPATSGILVNWSDFSGHLFNLTPAYTPNSTPWTPSQGSSKPAQESYGLGLGLGLGFGIPAVASLIGCILCWKPKNVTKEPQRRHPHRDCVEADGKEVVELPESRDMSMQLSGQYDRPELDAKKTLYELE